MAIYTKLSHEFAVKQLIERFCFEMEVCEKIFGSKKITLEKLKNDCRSYECFDEEEYKKIFKESIKLKKEHAASKTNDL